MDGFGSGYRPGAQCFDYGERLDSTSSIMTVNFTRRTMDSGIGGLDW